MNPTAALMLTKGIEEDRRRDRRRRVANEEPKPRADRISLVEIWRMRQLQLEGSEA